jgi:hypothetical protein
MPMQVWSRDILCKREASLLCKCGGRVMEHMDIYDMSFDELVDYIGDGDPAEIIG